MNSLSRKRYFHRNKYLNCIEISSQWLKKHRQLAFVLIFPKNYTCTYIWEAQNKNKLKEKHAKSSEQLVNRVPTSIYTSFISVDFEKNMPVVQHSDEQIEGQVLLYIFIVYLAAKQYPEQRITKRVAAKNDRPRK